MYQIFLRGKTNILPFITFFILILISLAVFFHLRKLEEDRLSTFFADRIARVERAVKTRIQDYNQVLLCSKAYIELADTVTAEEWRQYYKKTNVKANYPGIHGLGYAIFISPENLDQHIASMRSAGFQNYTVKPEGERPVYTSIVYLEPFAGSNIQAHGFDMFSHPVRRDAMKRARDTGLPALSGKVTLVQEKEEKPTQPGFLLYVPVYKQGTTPENVQERRKLIKGFAYSPFRAYDLFEAILSYRFPELQIQVYDGKQISESSLLYEKEESKRYSNPDIEDVLTKTNRITVAGHVWSIKYSIRDSPAFNPEEEFSNVILVGGIIVSSLIYFLMIFQSRTVAARRAAVETIRSKNFVIESMPEKVLLADSKGNISYFNKSWLEYTGISEAKFTEQMLRNIIHPKDWERAHEIMSEAFRVGKNFTIEHRLKKEDGTYRWHLHLGTPQKDETGKVIAWVASYTDIHEQKLQMEELQRINSDLDNFVYTASHDLRAPISNMEGLLLTIYEETRSHCTEDVISLFDMINISIQRLKTTISDLTEISRVQRMEERETELIEVESILSEFKEDHKDLIESNKALIVPELPVRYIRFSRRNFRSIVYNLVSNAIKYRSPDRQPEVRIKTEQVDHWVVLTVSDNGLGLNATQKERIFGMFKRMHTHVEGTGIGLYIVKRIVETAGGKIEVEGNEGEGSIFKVYLPAETNLETKPEKDNRS